MNCRVECPARRSRRFGLSLLIAVLLSPVLAPAWPSRYWEEFRKQGPTGDALPDFSYAGYRMGDAPIPDVPQAAVATDFGAVPNDEGDDTDALQRAVDAVAAQGGGALFIPAGRYYINSSEKDASGKAVNPNKCLRVTVSGVVLRGAGSGADGTILHLRNCIKSIQNDATVVLGKIAGGGVKSVLTRDGARGDREIQVDSTAQWKAGQRVILSVIDPLIDEKAPRADRCEIPNEMVAPFQLRDDLFDTVGRRGKRVDWPVRIAEVVDGRTLRLVQPLRSRAPIGWGAAIVEWRQTSDMGIEHIRFESDWPGGYAHHKPFPVDAKGPAIVRSADEQDYRWNAILITRVWDGWVRDVTIQDYTQGINATYSKNLTFRDMRIVGKCGHTAITLSRTCDSMIEDIRILSQRIHTFFVAGMAAGNVFRNSVVDYPHDAASQAAPVLDFHGLFPYENLYENIEYVYVLPGGGLSYLPHAGVRNVFWNIRCPKEMSRGADWKFGGPSEFFRTYAKTTSGEKASAHEHWPQSFLVGVTRQSGDPITVRQSSENRHDAWLRIEGLNKAGVEPASLYEAQRALRRAPAAVR